jgi:hypothetical protein
MVLPEMALVEQIFDPQKIDDIPAEVARETETLSLANKLKRGHTVAITAGSRGIRNIDVITKSVVRQIKELGGNPFIIPAMGSHGGATPEGQIKVLQKYGISESTMGCPIRSTMEVVRIGDARDGYPVFVDRYAMEADHIVVVNRIKPHTKFEGPIESGLMKMMAIGMGNHQGAQYYHRAAICFTFPRVIETVATEILRRCQILFGLGVVENAYDEICLIKALLPEDIYDGEKALLVEAKARMPRLPFDEIDVLIVDEIGKNISGTGMDTNVTGRNRDILGNFASTPRIKRIFVRDLTKESEGNATGIGFADFTTSRLVNKIDRKKTYINSLAGISPEKAAIPMYFDKDIEAIEACLSTIGDIASEKSRVVHIRSTLHLNHISVSRAFEPELIRSQSVRRVTEWQVLEVGEDGNIVSPFLK